MWARSVRASHLERTGALPGDELIPEPIGTLTHAITAGWHSYDGSRETGGLSTTRSEAA